MSNAVFPNLKGLSWPVVKTPEWSTIIQKSASGRETRAALMSYPLWNFKLTFDYLPSNNTNGASLDLQAMLDFFNSRQGAFDNFLFDDQNDDSVTAQSFGTGDGTTVGFQLQRQLQAGGFFEPVMNLNGAPSIYNNGVLQTVTTNYTINSTGFVTFTSAPAAGHALTWTGSYYFRCRFDKDMADFDNIWYAMFQAKELVLHGSLGVKV
jgi:uncharacterized protein (TIGR02217 family)